MLKVKQADEQTREQVSERTRAGCLQSCLSPRELAIRAPPPCTLHLYTRTLAHPHLHRAIPLVQTLVEKGQVEKLLQLENVSQVLISESVAPSDIELFKVTEQGASGCWRLNPRPDDVTFSRIAQLLLCRVRRNFSESSTQSSVGKRGKMQRRGKTRSRSSQRPRSSRR